MTFHYEEKPAPRLITSRDVYQGRVIGLRVDQIEVASGIVRRELVTHPGAVVILPIDSEGRILWILQHRWGAQRTLLELPAGTLEKDESPESTARRELPEETGFAAATWQRLGGFFTAPSFLAEYLHAFLATDLTPEQADGDDDEDIDVVPLSWDESMARVAAGQIEDAKSLAALMLYTTSKQR